jgi:Flp pilus assembly protein TadD
MRQVWWLTGLLLGLAGCASTSDERLRVYTEDGINLFQHGNYLDAHESFQAALTLKPQDPDLLYNLGACYDQLGDNAKAENHYRACLQHNQNHVACRHALTVLLVRNNRRPEAIQMLDDWLAREPKMAAPYAEDGWLLRQMDDLQRAQVRLQQALELDPHDMRALTELGLVYEAMQRPDRAIVVYERALQQNPKQPALENRINFLLAKGSGRPRPE